MAEEDPKYRTQPLPCEPDDEYTPGEFASVEEPEHNIEQMERYVREKTAEREAEKARESGEEKPD